MSAFEFFFSFYGLLLGLSVAVLATGAARAFKHRKTVRVGWLTPLLAVFVALDTATFWDAAWANFRDLPFGYGLLVGGLVVAVIYYMAASLVFPDETDAATSLDQHFWASKRTVLILLILANLLGGAAQLAVNLTRDNGQYLLGYYSVTIAIYVALVGLAAWTKRRWLFALTLGLHTALYLSLAVLTVLTPPHPETPVAQAVAEGPQ
ncbi:hypothetical protein [Brevundimonas lenta]|uniref:Uncharacterized membrane protein (DUF485 family) n=1 Tax=Brevundimonas lenta TaxID=424796 RepID=A0A7W6JEQ2_9CAUL|nr:hypothetical protein [Brevundimonas lenta]MBB4083696.1 uncharacterized membrane protein (DUF485 family) [Brevundimonas lenta]